MLTPKHADNRQSFKQRLAMQQPLLGLLQLYPNPLLTELAGERGYDFLLLDGEHGEWSEREFEQSVKKLAGTDVLALLRLREHDTSAARRYVDMGADGVVVPHVSTAGQASQFAEAIDASPQASLIVIIESKFGVSNAEEIFAVEGVDGALIGFNDLSADLGIAGDFAHPSYAQALSAIERAAAATGTTLGTAPHGGHPLDALLSRGHRLIVLGTDRSLLSEAMGAQMAAARSCVGNKQS